MKKFYLSAALVILTCCCFAQQFQATPVNARSVTSLDSHFSKYTLYNINTELINSYAKANNNAHINLGLNLPGLENLQLSIWENDILAKDYKITVHTASGVQVNTKPSCITYMGDIAGQPNSKVRLTITNNLIYGIIKTSTKEYFIEPLNYLIKGQAADIFAVYETKDVNTDPSLTCGVTEAMQRQARLPSGTTVNNAGLNCVRTELAIASDSYMFDRYGSADAVQTHNIGVVNNIMWDYVNAQFDNNVEFVIAGQNISTIPENNQTFPLYNGTNSGTILANFRGWGQAGNFGFNYDLATIWTTRDIDGDGAGTNSGIVGLAYLGVVCDFSRYQLLEDFAGTNATGSGFALRVLASHETGHNFNCAHDAAGSPFIMAPTVQNTTAWSAASIASADGHINTRTCLAQCSTAGLTRSDFISSSPVTCVGGSIEFKDRTLGGPTSWSWVFQGGSPATSSDRNPSVTFATAGLKNISLTTDNGNGATVKVSNILVTLPPPVACINNGTDTTDAGIKSFSLNGINKISGGTQTDGNKYLDFSCTDNTLLDAGSTYNASAVVGNFGSPNRFNLVQLYIDYNNDGDFADAGENVYSSSSCYIGTHTFSFTTPANPPVTNTMLRMRLMAKDCVGGINPCYNSDHGQVEDYGVTFLSIVPVKLLSFEGYHNSGNNYLSWVKTSQVNFSHFEVERSIDGSRFNFVGRKNVASNSPAANYSFTDDLTGNNHNKYYYRLKMVDLDGNFTYSAIVVITIDSKGKAIVLYPNPVKTGTMLQVNLQDTKAAKIELINSIGQVMYVYPGNNPAGTISIPTLESWATGQYIIRITNSSRVQTQKIMLY